MKVALVHDWLVNQRGGENVLLELARLFPDAPIYTLVHIKGRVHPDIERHDIHTSFIQALPGAPTRFRGYLPLFPRAIESFDLARYDLVLSTSHCVAKGVRTHRGQRHIAYVHTPMRYLWDQAREYVPGFFPARLASFLSAPLRSWDVLSAARPDLVLANSCFVAKRIERAWGRQAEVVYPPVDVGHFSQNLCRGPRTGYLVVSALARYKRIDLAVRTATRYALPLTIIGDGMEGRRLRRLAGPSVTFAGAIGDRMTIREAYGRARALLFCGVEDFGIAPVEAMAAGCPVVAFGEGGLTETVSARGDAATGVFFTEQSPECLMQAIQHLEAGLAERRFEARSVSAQSMRFCRENFRRNIQRLANG